MQSWTFLRIVKNDRKWWFSSWHLRDQISSVVNFERRYILRMVSNDLRSDQRCNPEHFWKSTKLIKNADLKDSLCHLKRNEFSIWPRRSTPNAREIGGKFRFWKSNGWIFHKMPNKRWKSPKCLFFSVGKLARPWRRITLELLQEKALRVTLSEDVSLEWY